MQIISNTFLGDAGATLSRQHPSQLCPDLTSFPDPPQPWFWLGSSSLLSYHPCSKRRGLGKGAAALSHQPWGSTWISPHGPTLEHTPGQNGYWGSNADPRSEATCIPAEAPSRCNCQGFKPRRSSQDGNSDHRLGFPAVGLRCAGKNVWHARNRQRVYLLGPHGPIPCLSQSQKVKYPISTPIKTQVSTWQHFSVSHHPPIPQNHRPLLGRLLQ